MADAPVSGIACEEKDRLMRQYIAATSDYSRAVQELQSRTGVMKKAEYNKLYRYVENAREAALAARAALDQHTAEHGC